MNPLLKVLTPGLFTTVQDLGRRGYAAIGLPPSGPLDAVAMRLANALVGNDAGAPVLECLVQGPGLDVLADSIRVAVVGGSGDVRVEGGRERKLPVGRSIGLRRGEVLRVGALTGSSCGYIAVEGGFAGSLSFGSRSTYTRAAIGGYEGRPLRTGDILSGPLASVEARPEKSLAVPLAPTAGDPIRVVLGPQDDYFTSDAIETFLSATFRVSTQADRMGFRLEGPVLAHAKGFDIVSDGIVSGSIQVPGSGQPIVLMRDNQTAGGYPKIATVISADLSVLGRRGPGSPVRFQRVGRDEAEGIRREQEAWIESAIGRLRDVREEAAVDLEALYSANLIGGTVNALGDESIFE